MRTRRNGESLELPCEACDRFYAEVLPDRLLIFSFHFGKVHMTVLRAAEMASIFKAAAQGRFEEVKCGCGLLPCAVIQLGRMSIKSKHKVSGGGSQVHCNVLTLEGIAAICEHIGQLDVIYSQTI